MFFVLNIENINIYGIIISDPSYIYFFNYQISNFTLPILEIDNLCKIQEDSFLIRCDANTVHNLYIYLNS